MISVRNLVKNFGDFAAVKDISFEVRQGEIFAFLGHNGAWQDDRHQDAHDLAEADQRRDLD